MPRRDPSGPYWTCGCGSWTWCSISTRRCFQCARAAPRSVQERYPPGHRDVAAAAAPAPRAPAPNRGPPAPPRPPQPPRDPRGGGGRGRGGRALAVGETRVPVPAEMPMPPGDPGPGGATVEGARARTPAWTSAAARLRPTLLALVLPVEASLPHRRPPRLLSPGGGLAGALPEPASPPAEAAATSAPGRVTRAPAMKGSVLRGRSGVRDDDAPAPAVTPAPATSTAASALEAQWAADLATQVAARDAMLQRNLHGAGAAPVQAGPAASGSEGAQGSGAQSSAPLADRAAKAKPLPPDATQQSGPAPAASAPAGSSQGGPAPAAQGDPAPLRRHISLSSIPTVGIDTEGDAGSDCEGDDEDMRDDNAAMDPGTRTPVWPPLDATVEDLESWQESLAQLPQDEGLEERSRALSRRLAELREVARGPPNVALLLLRAQKAARKRRKQLARYVAGRESLREQIAQLERMLVTADETISCSQENLFMAEDDVRSLAAAVGAGVGMPSRYTSSEKCFLNFATTHSKKKIVFIQNLGFVYTKPFLE